ncbi:hypothetical protein ACFW0H_14980 [Pseudomonas sp. CR3202]|uniref:hypothetical protein n=1 Tax=Pseudomonas sp. CR3202 TaxID=3351532 RepID=UPI003BF27321
MKKLLPLVALLALSPAPAQAQMESDFSIGGAVRVGWSTTTCNAAAAGAIRYNSGSGGSINFCNGSTWTNIGGGGTPAGATREIQFNSGGAFGASSTFKLMADGDLLLTGTHTGTASVPVTGVGTRMFFDTQKSAFRAGRVTGAEWDDASIGSYSVAMGWGTTASGNWSTALGEATVASGGEATAMGQVTTASGQTSTATGYFTTAAGDYSLSAGREVNVTATGDGSFGFGLTTTAPATDPQVSGAQSFGIFMGNQSAVNFSAANTMGLFGGELVIDPRVPASNLVADTALEIEGAIKIAYDSQSCAAASEGALRYNSASDTFEVCKTAGSWTNMLGGGTPAGATREIQFNSGGAFGASSTYKLMADGDLLLTGTFTGTASVPVSGAGTRMFFDTQKAAFRAGYVNGTQWDNASIGTFSMAMGGVTTASGDGSTALGQGTTANGLSSTAIGESTTASGDYSTAMGQSTTASGGASTAMGDSTTASGDSSTATGISTTASGPVSTAMGSMTTAGGDWSLAAGYAVNVPATGDGSFGFGLTTTYPATNPQVSGAQSFGIFMGSQNAVNFSAANTMGLFGGELVIDPRIPASNLVADTALEVEGAIKIAYDGQSCAAASEGALRYNSASDTFEVCKTAGSWTNMLSNGGTPAGADREIQFNSGGALAASTMFRLLPDGGLALGSGASASNNQFATAIGSGAAATGIYSMAIGRNVQASGITATAMGSSTSVSSNYGVGLGSNLDVTGSQFSFGLGKYLTVSGRESLGVALSNATPTTKPNLSGIHSVAYFLGNQDGVVFASGNSFGMFGGTMVIDPRTPASNLVANTALEVEGAIKIAYDGQSCAAASEGALRYNSATDTFEACKTAGSWTNMLGGGGSIDSLSDGISDGASTVFLGIGSGAANIGGNYNTAVGISTLSTNAAKMGSTAIGFEAMRYADSTATSTYANNTAMGYQALRGSTTASANTGTYNTAVGTQALQANTNGSYNVGVGNQALYANTSGGQNVAVGHQALSTNTTGVANTAVGTYALNVNTGGGNNAAVGLGALSANTTGMSNVAVGTYALNLNTTGNNNVGVGYQALLLNTTGGNNTALGYGALYSNVAKQGSTAIGYQAMQYADSTATGSAANNTALGHQALRGSTIAGANTGTGNTAVGYNALLATTSGIGNTAVGDRAMDANATGQNNVAIGQDSLAITTSGRENVAIGMLAMSLGAANGRENVGVGYRALEDVTGDYNIAIGTRAGDGITSGSSNIVIGNQVSVAGSSQLNIGDTIYGDLSTDSVTIGTTAGQIRALPPASQPIAAGGTIPADACGTVKSIYAVATVTTSTTDTFPTPGTTNTGCCMDVVNTGGMDITLDANLNFKTIGGANQTLNQHDAMRVCSNGSFWYQISAVAGNQ